MGVGGPSAAGCGKTVFEQSAHGAIQAPKLHRPQRRPRAPLTAQPQPAAPPLHLWTLSQPLPLPLLPPLLTPLGGASPQPPPLVRLCHAPTTRGQELTTRNPLVGVSSAGCKYKERVRVVFSTKHGQQKDWSVNSQAAHRRPRAAPAAPAALRMPPQPPARGPRATAPPPARPIPQPRTPRRRLRRRLPPAPGGLRSLQWRRLRLWHAWCWGCRRLAWRVNNQVSATKYAIGRAGRSVG